LQLLRLFLLIGVHSRKSAAESLDEQSFQQKLQQPTRRCDSGQSLIVVIRYSKSGRTAQARDQLFLAQLFSLFSNLNFLFRPGCVESTIVYELHNPAQLVAIKPGSVLLANVYNHSRTAREVDSIH